MVVNLYLINRDFHIKKQGGIALKTYKFILSFVFCSTLLLLSNSFAMPDTYFFNNFLYGSSPYYYTGTSDNTGLFYYPNPGTENTKEGFVTSFNNKLMNGNAVDDSIPLIDVDYTVGHVFELPAQSCAVFYSGSGTYSSLMGYSSDTNVYYVRLGTTGATNLSVPSNLFSYNVVKDTEAPLKCRPRYDYFGTFVNGLDSFVLSSSYNTSNSFSLSLSGTAGNGNYSTVWLVVNMNDDDTAFMTISSNKILNSDTLSDYTIEYRSTSSFTGSLNMSCASTNANSEQEYIYFLPHINGCIDIYSHYYTIDPSMQTYFYANRFGIQMSFFTLDGNLHVGKDVLIGSYSVNYNYNTTYKALSTPDSSLVPFFLNKVPYLSNYAVWIKDGYIAINNYDELISKLEQSGIGQTDLSRIIQLLEVINTGGDKGAEVEELMSILEQYHQQILNNADFNSATGVFDTYKNILEFTSDMHWLVTANNALFEYFAGFIMLCCMFLFLSRVMR